jgi:tyrosine-protein phosphatase SIW14
MNRLAAYILVCFIFAPQFRASASGNNIQDSLPNFHQVTAYIWRSGRPLPAGITLLAGQGLKVILDLEDDVVATKAEAKVAEALGIRHISLPISQGQPVTDALVNQALALLRQSEASPVLVHCYAGQDRTGMLMGVYRVAIQGWAPLAAYQEMLSDGFHQSWKDLDQYFHGRTGLPY